MSYYLQWIKHVVNIYGWPNCHALINQICCNQHQTQDLALQAQNVAYPGRKRHLKLREMSPKFVQPNNNTIAHNISPMASAIIQSQPIHSSSLPFVDEYHRINLGSRNQESLLRKTLDRCNVQRNQLIVCAERMNSTTSPQTSQPASIVNTNAQRGRGWVMIDEWHYSRSNHQNMTLWGQQKTDTKVVLHQSVFSCLLVGIIIC